MTALDTGLASKMSVQCRVYCARFPLPVHRSCVTSAVLMYCIYHIQVTGTGLFYVGQNNHSPQGFLRRKRSTVQMYPYIWYGQSLGISIPTEGCWHFNMNNQAACMQCQWKLVLIEVRLYCNRAWVQPYGGVDVCI